MIQKAVLTIAGSDSSGGAGIQADLKTMEALDVYGMSVITALTAQNTVGISAVLPIGREMVEKQLRAVFDDIYPDAVKIGMLPDLEVMETVAEILDEYQVKKVVLDPVLSSTSGTELSAEKARSFMKNELFNRCLLVTPNIPEAEKILGMKIASKEEMEEAAGEFVRRFGCSVLIKGGHSSFYKEGKLEDLLLEAGNNSPIWIVGERIDNPNTHGTGCTLSSAIACFLARGLELEHAVREGRKYLQACIEKELDMGQGRGPLYHRICKKIDAD
ncbi:bifunctional hydroxymethylpyrimidine kinase/phosphomethylpyrimidine kinase [Butyrivibrio sp. YAB3001]|uniref:bifunctional hydroxymethylpyrimidine kinase/phosphomethylpyrimidine kinase n=1 Tax=Butyrivibrio sp. YAB3001 TaxID=1520812 RepID=UPI0008F6331D|nr:bifunctional hydroxymethylpyrimidine kinase/phosphomethylpyrimidine kinase [Butyrivibrio sp. YAB3001]SFD06676.1 hydroxymethylpyrimidine/phosphomethylpyrimidine kinase [Butyrivibrio sp. YAB3001]